MVRRLGLGLLVLCLLAGCAGRRPLQRVVDTNEVKRILHTLAADDMQGRAAFTPGAERAADFIAAEFTKIGLQPFTDEPNFRQTFEVVKIHPTTWTVTFDGVEVPEDRIIVSSNRPGVNWNTDPNVSLISIQAGDDFAQRFREAATGEKDAIVVIDTSFANLFNRYRGFLMRERVTQEHSTSPTPSVVYVLANNLPISFRVAFTNTIEKQPLFNVIGMLPGTSLPHEYVIFSAHYDHIGILDPVNQDSIANGADDDASGVSAVISLAHYYKKRNDNARTLLFVTFTAEEIGLVGSKYFSSQISPEEVVAMINIEMIGKDARFGPNSLYVTGYDQSNLAEIMQQNVGKTDFTFHPDPYPTQNLFYRSDNASLAAMGVPAHTFATVQIDQDRYYHTVDDEVETLAIENIVSSIQAIAIGLTSIIAGDDTPTRIPKLAQ
ncbi:M20/M25/M40 family metallo-hydrolase [Parapedobacter sp. 10938]|uniref:M20/M25/M40 family metallo-hydrolase n=1 Tax=Parapedobacter flavus TaxID=3110225 RepID=UPI002DBECE88|nr:M20/M25/M40 family metallo-hydrolase [Parapedobacter sp. 10938]MEC3880641.1 M20/M25/M40 family metallo-hydrolase [Parapedobacter sp. 10938]